MPRQSMDVHCQNVSSAVVALAGMLLLTLPLVCLGCWRMAAVHAEVLSARNQAEADWVERRFRVVDARTGEPVAGAKVTVRHHVGTPIMTWVRSGETNAEGIAQVEVGYSANASATRPRDDNPNRVQATAEGYLPSDKQPVPAEGVPVIRLQRKPSTAHQVP